MAYLPEIDAAVVADAKLVDYLLNSAHPRGAAKARFLEAFGFSPLRPEELRRALLEHARQNEISTTQQTNFGLIFVIAGELPSPDGRNPLVRAVWMLDTGATAPRLITMVPVRRTGASRSTP